MFCKQFAVALFFVVILLSHYADALDLSIENTGPTTDQANWVLTINLSNNIPTSFSGLFYFWRVWNVVREKYVDIDKIDDIYLAQEACRGLLKGLRDKYSYFSTPEEIVEDDKFYSGEFIGFGFRWESIGGMAIVTSVPEGTPAFDADLRVGDNIVAINGKRVESLNIGQISALCRNPDNPSVILDILRRAQKATVPVQIKITRKLCDLNKIIVKQLGKIGYIKIQQFSAQSIYENLSEAAKYLKAKGVDRIIVDLRNNPGGELHNAIKFCTAFVGDYKRLWTARKARGLVDTFESSGDASFPPDWPIICLINQYSASAAEISAGVLKELRGAMLLGEKSLGKSSMQEFVNFENFGKVKISVGYLFLPSGYLINGQGLTPDLEVTMSDDDKVNKRDPQLDKAVELILKKERFVHQKGGQK